MQTICPEIFSLESIGEPDSGDKIIFPSNFVTNNIESFGEVIIFCLRNIETRKIVHCSLLRFIVDYNNDDSIYAPARILNKLGVREGSIIEVSPGKVLKGSFIKLKPFKNEFCSIDSPKEALEKELTKYILLNLNDVISVKENNKEYKLTVTEIKDINKNDAETIIVNNVDLEVDFEPADDYVEPVKPSPSEFKINQSIVKIGGKSPVKRQPQKTSKQTFSPFSGKSYSLKD